MADDVVEWINSVQARKAMRVSACQLAHLRLEGCVRFRKQGNAFLYSLDDCLRIARDKSASKQIPCAVESSALRKRQAR